MRILLLAGEESGVLYARQIAAALRTIRPDVEIRGYEDYGFLTGDLAVIGFFAVLRRLFYFLGVKRTMICALDEWKPDVVCTVDYPGLNLRLAAAAKRKGIRTVHVVCPQVWAWHQGRIPKIERSLDRLCCFFPFEPAIFKPGFAEFVGHPLARGGGRWEVGGGTKEDNPSIVQPSTSNLQPIVALLPGSRIGEIDRILLTLLEAAKEIGGKFPDVRFVIPAANEKARKRIDALARTGEVGATRLEVTDGGARGLLERATCAVVASGTATLEAALADCPTVLVYRVGALTAWLARRVIRGVKHLGLANIIAEKAGVACPMPELLQEDFTAEAVARQLTAWLGNDGARTEAAEELRRTMALLKGGSDPIGRIAEIVVSG